MAGTYPPHASGFKLGQCIRKLSNVRFNNRHFRKLVIFSFYCFFSRPALRFARVVTSCNIKKESEGTDLRSAVASPVKLSASVDGSCLGLSSLASDPSTQASTLPGITPTNFANIPNRLRRHFLHMMHTAIKKQFASVLSSSVANLTTW